MGGSLTQLNPYVIRMNTPGLRFQNCPSWSAQALPSGSLFLMIRPTTALHLVSITPMSLLGSRCTLCNDALEP